MPSNTRPDGGHIHIMAAAAPGADGEPEQVEVVVRDSGIGIDPDHQELIFEKFYQTGHVALDSSGLTKFMGGGPGLGLAIAKGIVEAHNGRIWAISSGRDEQKLQGSSFYARLPLQDNIAATSC